MPRGLRSRQGRNGCPVCAFYVDGAVVDLELERLAVVVLCAEELNGSNAEEGVEAVDENRTMLLVAPRKPGSTWSASNKRRVAKLIEQGVMTPLGQAKVNSAKKDGSWTFLDDVEKLIVPDDLAVALNKNNRGKRNFEAFNASARKVILIWIKTAKRQETREKRISETVRLATKNLKAAHPECRGQ